MEIKVSIIVPVYNNTVRIKKCIESLLNQTLEEIEIILVNDCSTDNTIDILKKYSEKNADKIQLIDLKQNKRPGGARNEGIKVARGMYIGFVDSDDFVEAEMYEEMYNIAVSGDYDMVDCGFHNVKAGKNALSTIPETWGELDVEKRKKLIVYSGFFWSKIIKKNIFIENNLKFREKVTFEDTDLLPFLMVYIKKVYATDFVFYHYCNNYESITNTADEKMQIEDRMTAMRCLVQRFKDAGVYEEYKDAVVFNIYNTYIYMIQYYTYALEGEEAKYEDYKKLRDFFFELVDFDYSDNIFINTLDKKKRMYAELNNYDSRMIIDTIKGK